MLTKPCAQAAIVEFIELIMARFPRTTVAVEWGEHPVEVRVSG